MTLSGDAINLETNQTAPYFVSFDINTSSGTLSTFASSNGCIQTYQAAGLVVTNLRATLGGKNLGFPSNSFAGMSADATFATCAIINNFGFDVQGFGFGISWPSAAPSVSSKNPVLNILQMGMASVDSGRIGEDFTLETVKSTSTSVPEPDDLMLLLLALAFIATTRWRGECARG